MTTFTGIVYYKDGKEVKKMSEEEFNKIKDSTEFVDELKDKVHEQYDEIQELKRQIKIKNEYMHLIYAIGFDYDGYNDVKNLKDIIDELVDYSKKAVRCDDEWIAYEGGDGKKLNILMEEIK